jgi:hypothetical protein
MQGPGLYKMTWHILRLAFQRMMSVMGTGTVEPHCLCTRCEEIGGRFSPAMKVSPHKYSEQQWSSRFEYLTHEKPIHSVHCRLNPIEYFPEYCCYIPAYTSLNISKYSFRYARLPFISGNPFSLNPITTFRIRFANLINSFSPWRRS